MAEITSAGYKIKTQNQWFEDEKALYLRIDPQWNLDPSTPDGLKMASDAETFNMLDETLMQAYNSKDPAKATRYDLDVLCSLTGTRRSKGSGSSVQLTLMGVSGTQVPAGTRIDSATTGTRWATDQTVTLTAGQAEVQATCTVVGPTQADAFTITKIVDVTGGLVSVTNKEQATLGTGAQQDDSLRVKRTSAVGRPGNNQIDSLYGELYAVAGVRRVRIYENDGFVTDPDTGLPAGSVAVVVDGGEVPEIAMAIYIKKNPGSKQFQVGTPVSFEVTSLKYPRNKQVIKYSTPVYRDIMVHLRIIDDGTLPSDASTLIKQAYLDFTNGDMIPADVGFKARGFDIGEDVPFSTMYTPVNKVIGSYGNSYVESMTLNGVAGSVVIAPNELSRWTAPNIQVDILKADIL